MDNISRDATPAPPLLAVGQRRAAAALRYAVPGLAQIDWTAPPTVTERRTDGHRRGIPQTDREYERTHGERTKTAVVGLFPARKIIGRREMSRICKNVRYRSCKRETGRRVRWRQWSCSFAGPSLLIPSRFIDVWITNYTGSLPRARCSGWNPAASSPCSSAPACSSRPGTAASAAACPGGSARRVRWRTGRSAACSRSVSFCTTLYAYEAWKGAIVRVLFKFINYVIWHQSTSASTDRPAKHLRRAYVHPQGRLMFGNKYAYWKGLGKTCSLSKYA